MPHTIGGDERYEKMLMPPFHPGRGRISEEAWEKAFHVEPMEATRDRNEQVSLDGKRTVRTYHI